MCEYCYKPSKFAKKSRFNKCNCPCKDEDIKFFFSKYSMKAGSPAVETKVYKCLKCECMLE